MKNVVLSFWMLLITVGAVRSQTTTLSLRQCVEAAIANNVKVRASGLQAKSAGLNYDQARYNRLPVVSGGFGYGLNTGRSIDPFTNGYINQQLNSSGANVQVQVPVFNGFRTQAFIKQNEWTARATEMDWQQEKDNLTLEVIMNYLLVLNNEDLLGLSRQQAAVTRGQVERLLKLSKEGAIAPSELTDMQGQLAADEMAVMNAEVNLETAKMTLAQLMNMAYSKELRLVRDAETGLKVLEDLGVEKVYQSALEKLAVFKANAYRVQSAGYAAKVARADRYPSVSLFGQLQTNYSSAAMRSSLFNSVQGPSGDYVVVNNVQVPVITTINSFNSSKIGFGDQFRNNISKYAGLNVSIPVFSAFQTRTKLRLARVQEQVVRVQGETMRLQLRQAIEQAHLNWTNSYERYKLLAQQVTAFEESFRAAEIRFNEGAINSVQYLLVKNNLDRSRANFLIAGYEYTLRGRVLDFYMGVQGW